MAIDPITIGLAILDRVIDKDKPLSTTNVATAGGVGLGGAAYMLIESGDPTMALVGWGLGLVAAILTMYKEKKESK